MVSDSDTILARIIELKEESGLSFDELSIKSKVPLTSVKRYFNGETKSPGFLPLASVIVSLGGSVDEVLGVVQQAHKPANDDLTRFLQADLRYERKRKERWQIRFLALVAINLTMLILDILNPAIGYIRQLAQ